MTRRSHAITTLMYCTTHYSKIVPLFKTLFSYDSFDLLYVCLYQKIHVLL